MLALEVIEESRGRDVRGRGGLLGGRRLETLTHVEGIMYPMRLFLGVCAACCLGWVAITEAQVVTVPTFPAFADTKRIDVAAAYSGLYFLRTPVGGPELYVQRMHGVTFDPPVTVNWAGAVSGIRIAADANGGFIAVWEHVGEVYSRYLDVAGLPTGSPQQLSSEEGFTSGRPRVAGLAGGAAVIWAESIPNDGVQLFGQIDLQRHNITGGPHEWDVARTPDGGCVVAWHGNDDENAMMVQRFTADGDVASPPTSLPVSEFELGSVAVAPNGTMAIAGVRPTVTPTVYEVRAFRFAPDGSALGPEMLVATTTLPFGVNTRDAIMPTIEFDFVGNLYVVWGNSSAATPGVFVRAYDANGTPFGPSLATATEIPLQSVRTTRLPNGEFANTWITASTGYANVVSLCLPGAAVCGDGVLAPSCERCDDGAGNDDATPDACRTSCLPAHCGDGVTDAGEQCDDGNVMRCDGCTPSCEVEAGIVCGDGVAACGEQCDDGNGALLDGCTPACRLERILGGGPPKTDCLGEWTIVNPTMPEPYDDDGTIVAKQRCVDNDPGCDFDGGTVGSCTFHVRACGNNSNLAQCSAPSRLSSWIVERPSDKQAAKASWLAAVRASLLGAIPAAIVGPAFPDVCSGTVALAVPLRGAPERYSKAKLTLKTRAFSYEGVVDKDKIALECLPAS